jgi:hypothetical protein
LDGRLAVEVLKDGVSSVHQIARVLHRFFDDSEGGIRCCKFYQHINPLRQQGRLEAATKQQ